MIESKSVDGIYYEDIDNPNRIYLDNSHDTTPNCIESCINDFFGCIFLCYWICYIDKC
jgi:hypothetical protein